jgi:thymidylate kinase
MIYIIEGPDGSGKTTLATQLARQASAEIIHMSYPTTPEEQEKMFDEYVKVLNKPRNMIFDRCWYSEMAYGPVMRDKSYITWPQMYALERMVARTGGMIIHCTDAPSKLWIRANKRGEDYVVSRNAFDKICYNFNEIMMAPHILPVVTYRCPEVHA